MVKKLFKNIINEAIYGNQLLSLGIIGILLTCAIIADIKISLFFLLVIYCGLHSAYLFDRIKETKNDIQDNELRTQYIISQRRRFLFSMLIYALIAVLIIVIQRPSSFIFGITLLFFSLLYTIVFKKLTKRVPGFKNFFVALMWSLTIPFLFYYQKIGITSTAVILSILFFLKHFSYELFEDIKDIKSDKKSGLLTFPILFKDKYYYFFIILNILFGLLLILAIIIKTLPPYSAILLIFLPYSFCYFYIANKNNKNRIAFLLADIEYLFWPMFILLAKNL